MKNLLPSEFYLGQNYPDPFSEKATIKFCVAYKSRVRLDLCDNEKKPIQNIMDEQKDAGTYRIEIDAGGLNEGVYLYTLRAGEFESTRSMVVKKEPKHCAL